MDKEKLKKEYNKVAEQANIKAHESARGVHPEHAYDCYRDTYDDQLLDWIEQKLNKAYNQGVKDTKTGVRQVL